MEDSNPIALQLTEPQAYPPGQESLSHANIA